MSLAQETARKWKIAAAVVGITTMIVVVLKLTAPDPVPQLQSTRPVRVDVYTIRQETVSPQVEVTGRLQPANRTQMRFELSGQLAERAVEPGQQVRQGDLLLRLADGDFRDALADAEATLAMQRAAVRRDRKLLDIARRDRELQKREVTRLEKLGNESLVSASRLDQARQQLLSLESKEAELVYKVDTAQAQITISESGVARATRNLERASLRAPFDGTVNSVELDVGDYVSPNQPALELIDTRFIDLYVEVSGQTISALGLGQTVNVMVGGKSWQGTITALQHDPDPSTFTHALRIRLQGKGLLTGQLASATLPLQTLEDVLTVPVSAILRDEGRDYVFVIRQEHLHRVQVQTADRYEDRVILLDGVSEGERIVSRDVAALTAGQAVVTAE